MVGQLIPAARVADAVRHLEAGGVVAYPTETFYGLGVDPSNDVAVAAVLELKGRDAAGKPLLLLASTLDQVAPWIAEFPVGFETLAARFWPGPLTLVLPAASHVPASLTGPTGGVAVRLTPHPVARALIDAAGTAITATSANRAGAPPARDAGSAREAFPEPSVMVLDGGETVAQAPSSLVDLASSEVQVLRPGAISDAALEAAVEDVASARRAR